MDEFITPGHLVNITAAILIALGLVSSMRLLAKKCTENIRLFGVVEIVFGVTLIIPFVTDFFSPVYNLIFDTATCLLGLLGAYFIKKGIDNLKGTPLLSTRETRQRAKDTYMLAEVEEITMDNDDHELNGLTKEELKEALRYNIDQSEKRRLALLEQDREYRKRSRNGLIGTIVAIILVVVVGVMFSSGSTENSELGYYVTKTIRCEPSYSQSGTTYWIGGEEVDRAACKRWADARCAEIDTLDKAERDWRCSVIYDDSGL